MVTFNVKNFRNLTGKLFIDVLSIILIYFILLGAGFIVSPVANKYIIQLLGVYANPHINSNPYIYDPLLGILVFLILFFSIPILYAIVMLILSLIVNFLWKKDVIEFTCDTKKIGFLEKILRHIWKFID